jgi:hypothetical protein
VSCACREVIHYIVHKLDAHSSLVLQVGTLQAAVAWKLWLQMHRAAAILLPTVHSCSDYAKAVQHQHLITCHSSQQKRFGLL